jgi:uncharacterized protein YfaS (alpha-2-macroglobulin family)
MKTTCLLGLIALALTNPTSAADLIFSTETLTPESTIELRFETPIVSKEKLGSVEKSSPLLISPKLEGEFKWTSSRSGQFHITKGLEIGTEYHFSLRPGIKDVAGKQIPAEDFGVTSSEDFHISEHWRASSYSRGFSGQRTPLYMLQFNDSVSLDDAQKLTYFQTSNKAQKVPAVVRYATSADFKKYYRRSIEPTWEERGAGIIKPVLKNNETRSNTLMVTTAEPLPIGKVWTLVIEKELKNQNGKAELSEAGAFEWGSISALAITGVEANPHFDSPHAIDVQFNKQITSYDLKPEEIAKRLAPFVTVEPAVPNMKIEASYTELAITGDYELNKDYRVTISKGLPAIDDLGLEKPLSETVVFHPSHAFISTTASTNTQLSKGKGVFDIYAANFKSLHVRVKQLSDGELLKAREILQEFKNTYKEVEKVKKLKDKPFEELPGKAIYDKAYANQKPLEKATLYTLNWKEILGQTPSAPVIVELEADAQDGAEAGTVMTRAIVEFTDIGLLVKSNKQDAIIYAFSLQTGEPLPNVGLTLADNDRGLLRQSQTDAQGLAAVPSKDAAWILAKMGDDCTALPIGNNASEIPLWGQGIYVARNSPFKKRFKTFLFSDRPVYKPGDIANIKAITRSRTGGTFSLGDKPITAQLTVSDPRGHEVLTKKITFTANGTWSDGLKMPDGATGSYNIAIEYDTEGKNDNSNSLATLDIRVDEYKTNTFEVALDGKNFTSKPDRVTVPLKARYYMGKALSSAKASWNASISQTYTPPEAYAEYHFGDVPSWWHYGQDREEDNASDEEDNNATPEWGAHGEITLADDGTAELQMPPPPLHKAALPQTITVYADVTDVNQQTISATTEFKLPGADYIVGVKKNRWYATAGQPMDFDLAAITPAGEAFNNSVPVEIKIERQQWNTVRVETAGNAATVKNQATLVEEQKISIQLKSLNGKAAQATLAFTPKSGGTYFLTATSKDAQGKSILSRVPFYVISHDSYPWAWDDGSRMKLEPDKTKVKPGEEVSIVVKTPIAGKALVTIERNRIHRQFIAPISPENPVVKIPFTDEDAPNCFVSVVVIRGAEKSPQADPMPVYKVGYCEITVDSQEKHLIVNVDSSQSTVRPGDEINVGATVKDSKGHPVENAEVTLYAVDEGVLSLMAYQTPQPFEFFHVAQPLAVNSYCSVDSLINETLDERNRGNKGIIIGGGGDEAGADAALRKNFVATALWSPALISDKDGRVTAKVKVPDSLTRYRIMAVAIKDADRFGNGESAFTVNKLLMIEPVVPRFAHVDDELLIKAVVHNTTSFTGQVEVEVKLDETAVLITEQRSFALISMKNRTQTNDGKSERRVITLKAGETTALPFPIRIVKQGTVAWQWRVHTTQWPDKPLSDAVESKFEVTHAAPALREVHYFELTSAAANDNLLKKINPQLLESDGSLRLDFSQSRMSEARDALEHILHYPYGCVEQTTSSTLPWLALSKYEPMFPDLLQKDKVRAAIQRGADRLLQMQTGDGGLAYWPGGTTPLLWASAYGGFGLIKAKEWGVSVPDSAIDKMTDWMSKQLRELKLKDTTQTYDLCDAALALYTLAKAGKPDAAYQDILYARRDRLPDASRAFLALAMCITNAPEKQIAELLNAKPGKNKWERYWLGENTVAGLKLIACAHLGFTQEMNVTADELMNRRDARGHWGTTFSNAWILMGLSAAERSVKNAGPLQMQLTSGGQKSALTLASAVATTGTALEYTKQKGAPAVKVSLPEGQSVRGRIEVKAWPDMKTYQPVQKGFGLHRKYERLTPTGAVEPAKNLRVGDLIVVTLSIDVLRPNRYLALEDPLPSVFEPVNPEFTTQNKREDAKALDNAWMCDHRELRNDKALFFTDSVSNKGQYELRYLARVIAEGDVIAPPARIEAMYEPDHYGLSEINHVLTLPMNDGRDVAEK